MKRSRSQALLLAGSGQEMTLDALADYAGVHPEYVLKLVEFGLIEPIGETEADMMFRAGAVLRVRRIVRIRRDLGVNLAGVAVILRLTDELRLLRKEVEALRSHLDQLLPP